MTDEWRKTCMHCGKILTDGQYAYDHLVKAHNVPKDEAVDAVEAIGFSVDATTDTGGAVTSGSGGCSGSGNETPSRSHTDAVASGDGDETGSDSSASCQTQSGNGRRIFDSPRHQKPAASGDGDTDTNGGQSDE